MRALEIASLSQRVRDKVGREAKRMELRVRRRASGVEVLWIDYGWAELPFTDDGDDQEVLYHLRQKQWLAHELAVLGPLIHKGDTVFDIGANLGFYSAMFAAQAGPQGRVVAFEPAREVYAKLRATIERNHLGHVVALNLGCGSERGQALLRQVSRSTGNASLISGAATGETVQIRPLDEIPEARERPPQFIKIDVEGFESEVLAGARSILEEHRPVLYVELCGEYEGSTERSIALLEDLGYDTRALSGLAWPEVPNGSNFVIHPAAGVS